MIVLGVAAMLLAHPDARASQGEQAEQLRLQARERAEQLRLRAESAREVARQQAELAREQSERARELAERDREKLRALYERATQDLDRARWAEAIAKFASIVAAGAAQAEGALYWKAYAESKLGRAEAALATVEELKRQFKNSRWLRDAEALALEIRQMAGQPPSPDTQLDEDLKLMALNALLYSDQERALPILEQVLKGSASPRVKERALFVLAQSRSPKAQALMAGIARGEANPDLQKRAIRSLSTQRSEEHRKMLRSIYASTTDVEVKKAILENMHVSGDLEGAFEAARHEPDPTLRGYAIRQIGLMRGTHELWQLYEKETAADVKRHIINALFLTGEADPLARIARSDRDPEIRREAIGRLGAMNRAKTGPLLVELYGQEKEVEVKKRILGALFTQNNAAALVQIARAEKDPVLKTEAVRRLSAMKAPEAIEFMIELLKK